MEGKSDVQRKAAKGVAWSGAQQAINNLISFATYAVLARLLNPADFGLLAFSSVVIAFLQIFVEQGIPDALIQRKGITDGHLNAAFWFNLAVSCVAACALCLSAHTLALAFKQPKMAAILCGLAPGLIFAAVGAIQQAILRRKLDFKPLAIRSIFSTLVSGIIAIVFAIKGFGVWSLVAQQLSGAITGSIILWWSSRWRPSFSFSFGELRQLTAFGLHVITSSFLDFVNRRSDDFLIGYFLGAGPLGYYSLAYRLLVTMERLINSPINSVAFPAFSRLQDEPEKRVQLFYLSTSLTATFAFPIFLGCAAIAPDLITVVFGKQWEVSSSLIAILSAIGILHSIAFIHGALVRSAGKAAWQMWFTMLGAAINLAGFIFLVHFGIVYIVIWYVGSAYLLLPLDLMMIKSVLGLRIRDYLRSFIEPFWKGIVTALGMLLVAILGAGLWAPLRLMAEVTCGLLLMLGLYGRILQDPRAVLRSALG